MDKKLTIKTQFTQAITSLDWQRPSESGSLHDNSTCYKFIKELCDYFSGKRFSLLDFGCAGGQFVIDLNSLNNIAIGVDGGNKEAILLSSLGKTNWQQYENKYLFFADVSHPFEVIDENGELFLFDVISSFDFLEHPLPEEIPMVIENMKRHIKPNGFLLHQINLSSGGLHQCGRPKEWWNNEFYKFGFKAYPYCFASTARGFRYGGHDVIYRLV